MDILGIRLVDMLYSYVVVEIVVKMVLLGEVEVLMKGYLYIDELMYEVFNKDYGFCIGWVMSYIFVLDVLSYYKLLFLMDVVINICFNLVVKKDII